MRCHFPKILFLQFCKCIILSCAVLLFWDLMWRYQNGRKFRKYRFFYTQLQWNQIEIRPSLFGDSNKWNNFVLEPIWRVWGLHVTGDGENTIYKGYSAKHNKSFALCYKKSKWTNLQRYVFIIKILVSLLLHYDCSSGPVIWMFHK